MYSHTLPPFPRINMCLFALGDVLARIPVELAYRLNYSWGDSDQASQSPTDYQSVAGSLSKNVCNACCLSVTDGGCASSHKVLGGSNACVCVCSRVAQAAGAQMLLDMADKNSFWQPLFR